MIEVWTNTDEKIYNRVPSVKYKINDHLLQEAIVLAADEEIDMESLEYTTEVIERRTCCGDRLKVVLKASVKE